MLTVFGAGVLTTSAMPSTSYSVQMHLLLKERASVPHFIQLLAKGPDNAQKGQGMGMAQGPGMSRNQANFDTFDLNGDGKILQEELDKARS